MRSTVISVSVCLSVCLLVCLSARMSQRPHVRTPEFHQRFGTCYQWSWLGDFLTAVRYAMYFRFVDDFAFSYNRRNRPNQRRLVFFVHFVRWWYWGRGLPSPTASCFRNSKRSPKKFLWIAFFVSRHTLP